MTVTRDYEAPNIKIVYINHGANPDPPTETVTVKKTVTNSGETATVAEKDNEEHVVTKKLTIYPQRPVHTKVYDPKCETATLMGDDGDIVTKTLDYGDGTIHTVTVVKDGEKQTLTIINDYNTKIVKTVTLENGDKQTMTLTESDKDKVIKTVTVEDGDKNKIVKTITFEDSDRHIVTKTIRDGDRYYTVIVKPEPTITTVSYDDGKQITKVVEVPCTYTITAPPQITTGTHSDDDCETYTRTVTREGEREVEVIVVDPDTGKATCRGKENGLPCHSRDDDDSYTNLPNYTKVVDGGDDDKPYQTRTQGSDDPEYTDGSKPYGTGCDNVSVSTTIETVYNTVVVTVGPQKEEEEEVYSTVTTGQQKPRAPLSVRW